MDRELPDLPAWMPIVMPGRWAPLRSLWMGQVQIQKEAAGIILREHAGRNRSISPSNLRYLLGQMDAGLFCLTGETLIFDSDGLLCNGQTRLTALEKGDHDLEFLVAFGVDRSAFDFMDQGAVRTPADRFTVDQVPNASQVAAAVRLLRGWFCVGSLSTYAKTDKLDCHAALELLHSLPGIQESVRFGKNSGGAFGSYFVGPALLSSLHYILKRADSERGPQFFANLRALIEFKAIEEPTCWEALGLLANYIRAEGGARKAQEKIAAVTIKAWNAIMSGRPLKKLRFDREVESFPRVAGWEYVKLKLTDGSTRELPTRPTSEEEVSDDHSG